MKFIIIILATFALLGCVNKEGDANALFVKMVQHAQMAANESGSHVTKYSHYKAARMAYHQIIENYPHSSIALKLSTGELDIAGHNTFQFLELNQRLYEKSELEKDPLRLLTNEVLGRKATRYNIALLAHIMRAYAKAGRTEDVQRLYRSIIEYFETVNDTPDRDEFIIEGGVSYAGLARTTDSETELVNSFELAKIRYGHPKSTLNRDLYFQFAEAFAIQQSIQTAKEILRDLERVGHKDAYGNTDFNYIIRVAEVHALFDKEHSILIAEGALSELLDVENPPFQYVPKLLELIYNEGNKEKFKEDFEKVFSWAMQKEEYMRIYTFLELANLIKKLGLREANLIPIESVRGSYNQDELIDLSSLGEFYSALGFDLLALDAFDQAIGIASSDYSLYWVAEALARNGYYKKAEEIINSSKDDITRKSVISWIAKTKAMEGEYVSAMQTFNRIDGKFAPKWVDIIEEQMKSRTSPSYHFIEESYSAYLKLTLE